MWPHSFKPLFSALFVFLMVTLLANPSAAQSLSGVVYDSVTRAPVAGARVELVNLLTQGFPLPPACFLGDQQGQTTGADGAYQFDLTFADEFCLENDQYGLNVFAAASGYIDVSPIDGNFAGDGGVAFPYANLIAGFCDGDVDDRAPQTAGCQVQAQSQAPTTAQDSSYSLAVVLAGGDLVENNHIPLDTAPAPPPLDDAALGVFLRSVTPTATIGEPMRWTLQINNQIPTNITDAKLIVRLPSGITYRPGRSRVSIDGVTQNLEPQIVGSDVTWTVALGSLSRVSANFETISRADSEIGLHRLQAFATTDTGDALSGLITAGIRLIAQPTFDCADIVGTVFEDSNDNGWQDDGEPGLSSVEVYSATGRRSITDQNGRYSFGCVLVPNAERGTNSLVRVNTKTIPQGFLLSSQNPVTKRLTRGKATAINFMVQKGRELKIVVNDNAFVGSFTARRENWERQLDVVTNKLGGDVSKLTIIYQTSDVNAQRKRRLAGLVAYFEKMKRLRKWSGEISGELQLDVF